MNAPATNADTPNPVDKNTPFNAFEIFNKSR
jgi:hypothetical protein